MPDGAAGDHGEINSEELLTLAVKPPEELTFGDRLNLLWAAVRPRPDEDPQAWRKVEARKRRGTDNAGGYERPQYTNTWVAQQIADRYGVRITPSYLGKLRSARNSSPSLSVLQALAQFFKIDTAFLLPATTRADLDKIRGVRDDLLKWINGSTAMAGANAAGGDVSIELRLTGVTTADEAQRQVAVALAQWLESQRTQQDGNMPEVGPSS